MTSQPQPAPGEGRSASQYLRPLRDIAVYVLLAAAAVMLFVAVIRLIPSGVGLDFGSRAQDSFYSYVNLPTILFPLGAVLLSLLVHPQHPKAKLVTVVAVVEYAVAAVFAVIFGILVGLIKIAGFSVRTAFEELLIRAAWLAVFGVAAWATYQIWRHLFYVPRPKPQPGVYGQPQYGMPGTYPGQPGYGPAPSGPPSGPAAGSAAGSAQYGQPQYGPPQYGPPGASQPGHGQPGHGQPGYGQPGNTYGQPAGYPGMPPGATPPPGTWGQPPVSPQPASMPGGAHPAGAHSAGFQFGGGQPGTAQPGSVQPTSAQPSSGVPSSAAPSSAAPGATQPVPPGPYAPEPGYVPGPYSPPTNPYAPGPSYPPAAAPPGQGAYSGATQRVPQHDAGPSWERPAYDRTEPVRDDRPGFGPADNDPPRR